MQIRMELTGYRVISLQPHIVELILNRPADGTLLSNGHINLYFTDTTLQLRVTHPDHIDEAVAFIKPLQPLTAIEWHPSLISYLVSNIIQINPNSEALQHLKEYASDKQNHQIVTTDLK